MTGRIPDFSVTEIVQTSWRKVSGCKGSFWVILAVLIFVRVVMGILHKSMPGGLAVLAVNGVLSVFCIMLIWGVIYLGIQRASGVAIQYRMAGYVFDIELFFKMVGLAVLLILIFLPFTIFGVVLGVAASKHELTGAVGILSLFACVVMLVVLIYLVMRLYISRAIVIATKVNPWLAIKQSFSATKSHIWQLIGLTLINIGILILSMVTLGIGFIWTLPYFAINYGLVYKRLTRG